VEYDGKKFDSFDENPEGKSLKSEFRKLLEMNGLKIFKGIQQAGRTDKDVSAKENILYINLFVLQIKLHFIFYQKFVIKSIMKKIYLIFTMYSCQTFVTKI